MDDTAQIAAYESAVAAAIDAATAADGQLGPGRAYLSSLGGLGLSVPRWPIESGGASAPESLGASYEAVLSEQVVPDLYPFAVGLIIVGPTLIALGSADQQLRWCPAIARGKEIWCQMFSEPEAGSDLANVHTIGRRVGDDWCLRGQKVWTSRAHYADWGFCLARTEVGASKHAGLTMFAVDMKSPGVTVRPLIQMNGDDHFNEVFLDDCVVPDSQRIGGENEGWAVAMAALGFERAGASMTVRGGPALEVPTWLTDLIDGRALDAEQRAAIVSAFIDSVLADLSERRGHALAVVGAPNPAGSGSKLRHVNAFRSLAAAKASIAGTRGLLADDPSSYDVLTVPSMSIRGGTDEIQRNILAERVLGLPPEARVDKGPWQVTRSAGQRP